MVFTDFFRKNLKKLMIAVVALLEAALICCAATFAWIEGTKSGSVNTNTTTVSAGTGLLFTDKDGNKLNSITIKETTLYDCSSSDGRNFFFPTTEMTSSNLIFRKGNDADKNTKYISEDFNITSFAGASIYIDESSSVTCSNKNILKALRISLNFNDGTKPIVLCPGVKWTGYTQTNSAVTAITNAGKSSATVLVEALPFAEYTYSADAPLTTIAADETKRVTFSMWLEGTDANCTTANLPTDSFSINLILTTAASHTNNVTFVDYSPNQWVDNPSANGKDTYMFAIDKSSITGDDYSSGTAYQMKKASDNITYTTSIPDTVTDVIFARYDPDDENIGYNIWGAEAGVSMTASESHTYYGIGRGKDVDSVNYGYWVQNDCKGVIDLYITEASANKIYFTNKQNWSAVYAHFYTKSGVGLDTWPGYQLTWIEDNSYGKQYELTLPEAVLNDPDNVYVIFNNGGKGAQSQDGVPVGNRLNFYHNGTNNDIDASGDRTLFSVNGICPNIYFKSNTYSSAIAAVGKFDPSGDFNSSTNYGIISEYYRTNSYGEKIYHLILPADATNIIVNGNGKKSTEINPSDNFTIDQSGVNKIGYYFKSTSSYGTWEP
ncbi:MAG: starch-binding protein [Ruminococcus sp.]